MIAEPRRVFVTGALGFIGRAVSDAYRARGVAVTGMDRVAEPERGVVAGDVTRPGEWQRAVAGADLVVHSAAVVSNGVGMDGQWTVNVLGTRRALDAARDAGVRRFVHLSSVRAFSDRDFPDGVDERCPVRTDGRPYVDTKVAAEQVVLQAHAAGEVPVTVLRPADVYGPGSRPWTLLPVEMIRSGRAVLPARGRGLISAVFVDDLVAGILLAAAAGAASGQVLTLGGPGAVTIAEFFGHYARMLGKPPPKALPTPIVLAAATVTAALARARGVVTEDNPDTVRYLARTGTYSIAKARRLLGYDPQVTLEEGMRRTEPWLRAEGLLGDQRS